MCSVQEELTNENGVTLNTIGLTNTLTSIKVITDESGDIKKTINRMIELDENQVFPEKDVITAKIDCDTLSKITSGISIPELEVTKEIQNILDKLYVQNIPKIKS